ncbi:MULTISPECIES: KAP family P-loop NTPase fold protein [Luteimonas]|uniref:KAP family P-loop NTPase fold protein n=1 Tax=Luteimonas TaxID=83614 RepID=UPI00130456E2|nr:MULTISPECIES: P-loop NTPase fold protein [Luteimonas]
MATLYRPTNRAITSDDPFAADQLSRKDFAALLRSAIASAESDSWVIGLEGQWGTGKSYFLEMFEKDLRHSAPDWAVVVLDAWKAEAKRDPLISFTKAVVQATDLLKDALEREDVPAYEEARERLLESAAALYKRISSAARITFSPAAKGITTAAVVASGGDAIAASTLGEVAGAVAEHAVKEEIDIDDEGDAFHRSLAELVRTAKGKDRDRSPRVIVIVDDLDRCRPDYTISLIERMKHYFETPGIVFILSYDWNVLAQSARAAYSPELDADSYFRRLIDVRLPLPPAPTDLVREAIFEQLGVSQTAQAPIERRGREFFKSLLEQHSEALTMRDWQQVVIRLKFLWSSEQTTPLSVPLLTFILVGRFLVRDQYRAPIDEAGVKGFLQKSISTYTEDDVPVLKMISFILACWESNAHDVLREEDREQGAALFSELLWEQSFTRRSRVSTIVTHLARASGALF